MVSTDADPAEQAEVDESLSLAFLVVLQTLSPVERAIFPLREVFDYDYAEIASITGKSEDNCRQILARARKRIGFGQPRFTASKQDQRELANRFFAAAGPGNFASLVSYLAADADLLWRWRRQGGGLPAASLTVGSMSRGSFCSGHLHEGPRACRRPLAIRLRQRTARYAGIRRQWRCWLQSWRSDCRPRPGQGDSLHRQPRQDPPPRPSRSPNRLASSKTTKTTKRTTATPDILLSCWFAPDVDAHVTYNPLSQVIDLHLVKEDAKHPCTGHRC